MQAIVAPQSLTEGLTWVTAGLSVGYGAGAATVGGIADAHGARTAFLVVVGAGVAAGGLGALLHRRLDAAARRRSNARGCRCRVTPWTGAALP